MHANHTDSARKNTKQLAHRYQGRLDDPLCPQGIEELMQKKQNGLYPAADFVVCSPKKRCIQTAEIVCEQYEQLEQSGCVLIEDDLREPILANLRQNA